MVKKNQAIILKEIKTFRLIELITNYIFRIVFQTFKRFKISLQSL